jgi:hypothetical protein
VLTPSRVNGFANMLEAVRRRTRMLTANLPTFPSLLVTQEGVTAQVRPACTTVHHRCHRLHRLLGSNHWDHGTVPTLCFAGIAG